MAEALSDSESELDSQTPPTTDQITDQRPSLSRETLRTMKFNCLECCYESTFTEKLLTECKKATPKAVKPIDDIIFIT